MKEVYCINDEVKSSVYKDFFASYRGHIIVDENGWFEGYLKQVNYTSLIFVFGIYHPEKVFELFYCYGNEPEIFHGKISKNNFVGAFKIIGGNEKEGFEHKFTFSKGKISDVKMQEKIEYSKMKLKENCLTLYNGTYTNRMKLNDELLKMYEENPQYAEEKQKEKKERKNLK